MLASSSVATRPNRRGAMKTNGNTQEGNVGPDSRGEQVPFQPCSHDNDGNGDKDDESAVTRSTVSLAPGV